MLKFDNRFKLFLFFQLQEGVDMNYHSKNSSRNSVCRQIYHVYVSFMFSVWLFVCLLGRSFVCFCFCSCFVFVFRFCFVLFLSLFLLSIFLPFTCFTPFNTSKEKHNRHQSKDHLRLGESRQVVFMFCCCLLLFCVFVCLFVCLFVCFLIIILFLNLKI